MDRQCVERVRSFKFLSLYLPRHLYTQSHTSQWAKRRRYNVETTSELTLKRRCKMLKMQIVLTSIARRCYNVMKRRCFNVKIRRPSDVAKFTLKRRCENVENANRSDVDGRTLLQRH